jgi:ABC-type lipoprotein release transport system permease subunit
MKILFLIGWRNLWRHKKRSLVIITSIAIGIFSIIVDMSIMNGLGNQLIENNIKTALGHIAIHRKGFHDDMKLKYNFSPSEKIISAIKKEKDIVAYAPRIKVVGMINSSESSQTAVITGIDPDMEKNVSNLYQYTSKAKGSRFLDKSNDKSILISQFTASKLGLGVGDKLVLMLQNNKNELTGVAMTVAGMYQTPLEPFDKYFVFMNINKLREISGIGENISEIVIAMKERNRIGAVKEKLTNTINDGSLEILSWMDMAPYLVSTVLVYDGIIMICLFVLFIVVIFSVANVLLMAIMERFHEIGVMKSIGTKPSLISLMIIFEAVNLGIVGLGFGTFVGIATVKLLAIHGINLFAETARSWGTGSILYPVLDYFDIIMGTVLVFLTTVIGSIYPAIKAARIKPIDALHFT